jgi:CBS domain-containing protein
MILGEQGDDYITPGCGDFHVGRFGAWHGYYVASNSIKGKLRRLWEMFMSEERSMSKIPLVDDYMTRALTQFLPQENIHSATKTLLDKHISGAPVIDDAGTLVGVLSKKDCLKVVYSASYHKDWGGRVDEYMSRDVHTIDSGTDIVAAADLFVESNFRRFPVIKDGRVIGQISRQDILRALYKMA